MTFSQLLLLEGRLWPEIGARSGDVAPAALVLLRFVRSLWPPVEGSEEGSDVVLVAEGDVFVRRLQLPEVAKEAVAGGALLGAG